MKKIIKKWGDSLVIRLSPEEVKIYKLEEGSIVDVSIKKEGEGDECSTSD